MVGFLLPSYHREGGFMYDNEYILDDDLFWIDDQEDAENVDPVQQ